MNSLKSLFVMTVLAAVACGVYVSLNRKPDAPPPPGAPQGTAVPLKLEGMPPVGGMAQSGPRSSGQGGGTAPSYPSFPSAPSAAPSAPLNALGAATNSRDANTGDANTGGADTTAPPYSPPRGPAANSGGTAPPFNSLGSSASTAPPSSASGGTAALVNPFNSMPGAAREPAGRDAGGAKLGNLAQPSGNLDRQNAPATGDSNFRAKFDALMRSVSTSMDEGRLGEAHLTLSALYGNPEVPPELAKEITRMLDQMAATVIYSRQSILEPPYRVQPGDTLEKIAASYEVPPQLLGRINGIRDARDLQPGRELKVVRGPFSATVNLDKFEMTLMLKGRYAGRFPIGVGIDQPKLEGAYVVRDKKTLPAYEGRSGVIPSADPSNPLGKCFIDLGNQIGIHGTNNAQGIGRNDNRGTICLGEEDIEDVAGILSVGSNVVIQR